MAQYLGVDRSSISRMESGSQPMKGPVVRLLRTLAASPPAEPPVKAASEAA